MTKTEFQMNISNNDSWLIVFGVEIGFTGQNNIPYLQYGLSTTFQFMYLIPEVIFQKAFKMPL